MTFERWSSARGVGDEDGQVLPVVLVAVVALVAVGLALADFGRVPASQATSVTAADAAVLAAADEVADALEGLRGFALLATGRVDGATRAEAAAAAAAYATSNDATLVDLDIRPDGRRRVVVHGAASNTIDRVGEPLTSDSTTQRARSAAVVELTFATPANRGCLTRAQVDAAAAAAGVPSPASSGLLSCRGADVRNLRPELHRAVLRAEAAMGADVEFRAGFVTVGEQLARYPATSPLAPGGSLLHWGLGFEAGNAAEVAAALDAAGRPLCRPRPGAAPAYFALSGDSECGGGRPRPAPSFVGITIRDPRLVDPGEFR